MSPPLRDSRKLKPRASRHGFTLVERLAVITIIGVLASIALSKYAATKEQAVRASMLADLHNLAAVRESHFASCGDCANGITDGAGVVDGKQPNNGAVAFLPGPGNVITVRRTSGNRGEGWNASC